MTSPIDEPGPYPGRSSKFHGPAARSVLQVSVVVAPEMIAWIAWSTDGSTGRGGRVREVAAMGCSIRSEGSGTDDERAAIGELDALVVAVEAGRPVAAGAEAVGGDEGSGVLDLATEVGRIQPAAEDRLVDLPQLGEGELVREQAMGDPAVADLVAEAPQRVVHDLVVIEGQTRKLRGIEPRHVLDVVARNLVGAHQRPVHDRDHPRRRAVDGAECVQLLQVARGDAGRLGEGAG